MPSSMPALPPHLMARQGSLGGGGGGGGGPPAASPGRPSAAATAAAPAKEEPSAFGAPPEEGGKRKRLGWGQGLARLASDPTPQGKGKGSPAALAIPDRSLSLERVEPTPKASPKAEGPPPRSPTLGLAAKPAEPHLDKVQLLGDVDKVDADILAVEKEMANLKVAMEKLEGEEKARQREAKRAKQRAKKAKLANLAQGTGSERRRLVEAMAAENRGLARGAQAAVDALYPCHGGARARGAVNGAAAGGAAPARPVVAYPDAGAWQAEAARHAGIKGRLLVVLKKRQEAHHAEQERLAKQYKLLYVKWKNRLLEQKRAAEAAKLKKLGKAGERDPSAPTLRSQSRLRPVMSGVARSEYEEMQIISQLAAAEKLRTLIKIPAMITDPVERERVRFPNNNGLVADPKAALQAEQRKLVWSEEEVKVFLDKYQLFPKDFNKIATYLKHRTVGDCVKFFYLNQKGEVFSTVMRKYQMKKRRLIAEQRKIAGGMGMMVPAKDKPKDKKAEKKRKEEEDKKKAKEKKKQEKGAKGKGKGGEGGESRWAQEEQAKLVEAIKAHGKDFKAMAANIGTRSQAACKAFWAKNRKRLNLDTLVEEYNAKAKEEKKRAKAEEKEAKKAAKKGKGKAGDDKKGAAGGAEAGLGAAGAAAGLNPRALGSSGFMLPPNMLPGMLPQGLSTLPPSMMNQAQLFLQLNALTNLANPGGLPGMPAGAPGPAGANLPPNPLFPGLGPAGLPLPPHSSLLNHTLAAAALNPQMTSLLNPMASMGAAGAATSGTSTSTPPPGQLPPMPPGMANLFMKPPAPGQAPGPGGLPGLPLHALFGAGQQPAAAPNPMALSQMLHEMQQAQRGNPIQAPKPVEKGAAADREQVGATASDLESVKAEVAEAVREALKKAPADSLEGEYVPHYTAILDKDRYKALAARVKQASTLKFAPFCVKHLGMKQKPRNPKKAEAEPADKPGPAAKPEPAAPAAEASAKPEPAAPMDVDPPTAGPAKLAEPKEPKEAAAPASAGTSDKRGSDNTAPTPKATPKKKAKKKPPPKDEGQEGPAAGAQPVPVPPTSSLRPQSSLHSAIDPGVARVARSSVLADLDGDCEDSLGGAEWTSGAAKGSAVAKIPATKEEMVEKKVEKKPSAAAAAPETKAEVAKAASVVQSLHGTIEMETDQPAGGGAVSSAVEMGGKDEDDKVSQ